MGNQGSYVKALSEVGQESGPEEFRARGSRSLHVGGKRVGVGGEDVAELLGGTDRIVLPGEVDDPADRLVRPRCRVQNSPITEIGKVE